MALDNYEEIVTNYSSPTLVLAGPGSGKTYLLADRIKRLLEEKIDQNTITALTFGVEASQHMRDELIDTTGKFRVKYDDLPHISTMHSLGFEIVREKPHAVGLNKTDLNVQSIDNVKRLMFRDAALIQGFTEQDSGKAFKCKQRGDCVENTKEIKCKICGKYWEIMSKCNYIDFDDQILFACRILEGNPDILEKYQSRAEHLLVDEYQDINAAQFRFISLLSKKSGNGLFVVGDDAQSIYGFRGSDPEFILNFAEHFTDAAIATLAHSRRCGPKIMNDSFKVLEEFYEGWTRPQLEFHAEIDEEPVVWQLPSEIAEARKVAQIAQSFIRDKKSILILVPKKEFFPLIIRELAKRRIAYDCTASFLPDRIKIVKLFIDWVINSSNSFATRLVIEELLNHGIAKVPGEKKKPTYKRETIQRRVSIETDIAKLWESVDAKKDLFSVINNLGNPSEDLVKIRNGLQSLILSYGNFKNDNRGEFAKLLSVVTGIWCDPSKFAEDISKVVELLQVQRSASYGSVKLITARKAKGLEAKVVIMVGLEDDIVPNPRSDIIEEARLFYVSMTRAKENLFLFHSYRRPLRIAYGTELMEKPRSRFLDAIGKRSEWKGQKK